MTRTARHDGDGVSDVPEVITLSDDELSILNGQMTGGSFDAPEDPSVAGIPSIFSDYHVAEGADTTVHVDLPRDLWSGADDSTPPAPLPPQAPHGGSATGSFGSPTPPSGSSGSQATQGGSQSTGSFGSRVGGGSHQGGFLRNHESTPGTVTASRSSAIRGFVSRLPELWGLDLALTLVTVVGIVLIIANLSDVLLAIAVILYRLLDGALSIGVLVVMVALGIWFLFGRGRRR